MTIPGTENVAAANLGLPGGAPVLPARRRRWWLTVIRDPFAVVALLVLVLIALACALAPLLTSQSATASHIAQILASGRPGHPLGNDGVGRDELARLLYGGRTSLLGSLLGTVVALVVGVPTGLIAGYYGGRFDRVVAWVSNALLAVPSVIVLLVVLASVGQSTYLAMTVFGVLLSPSVFRLIRASVIAVRAELYIDAARVSGLPDRRIIRRHILPVVQAPTIIQTFQLLGLGLAVQSGLEFLGLGSTGPSWGSMLNDAFNNIYARPVLVLWPGLAVVLTVTATGILGNSLRDAVGVGSRSRSGRARSRRGVGKISVSGSAPADVAPNTADDRDLLRLESLTVSYERDGATVDVVKGVSLNVARGEVLGLVGESGSGKSQTAFAILDLLSADAVTSVGRLVFNGKDFATGGVVRSGALRGSRIGYVPQEPMSNLDPSFRIGSQLVEPMRAHLGLSRAAAKARARELLDRVGIRDVDRVLQAYPHQTSGGMAQRVLIAGAISCNPNLLIADEPTTALDVTVQAEVLDLLRSLQAEEGMGMIFVTHDFGVVADICDRVAVMKLGEIVETASVHDVFERPSHPYTRMLLDSTLEDKPPRGPHARSSYEGLGSSDVRC